MPTKFNVHQLCFLTLTTIMFGSCTKQDDLDVDNANFKVSSETVYLDEPCTFEAEDKLGKQYYKWNFGDGTFLRDGYQVSHQFLESGTFITNLNINGFNHSKTIRVFPGRLSYQIENISNCYLDVLIYIDNYEAGCTKRMYVRQKSKTDSIYATSNLYSRGSSFYHSHIFGISIFAENAEYTFADMKRINGFEHHTIIIDDTTRLIPRMSHGNATEVMLKDLFPRYMIGTD